jgi:hypothetical protein
MDNWDMKNTDSGPYSPFAEDALEAKYTKEVRCRFPECALDHCEHGFHVGENWLICKTCEENAKKPTIVCDSCKTPEGYCTCCEKCGKEQPMNGYANPGEDVCACSCPQCLRVVWDGLCGCCPHGIDTIHRDCKTCETERPAALNDYPALSYFE